MESDIATVELSIDTDADAAAEIETRIRGDQA